jgi:hypothetical protein
MQFKKNERVPAQLIWNKQTNMILVSKGIISNNYNDDYVDIFFLPLYALEYRYSFLFCKNMRNPLQSIDNGCCLKMEKIKIWLI